MDITDVCDQLLFQVDESAQDLYYGMRNDVSRDNGRHHRSMVNRVTMAAAVLPHCIGCGATLNNRRSIHR
jgi:hypothetical protein